MTEEAIAPLYDELMSWPHGGRRPQPRPVTMQAKNAVCRAAEVITRHLAAGSFRLDRTEAAFGYGKGHAAHRALPAQWAGDHAAGSYRPHRPLGSRGDGVYFRVIDYKSARNRALEAAHDLVGTCSFSCC